MPKFSSNLVKYALMKRSLCIDVKDIVFNAEIYPNILRMGMSFSGEKIADHLSTNLIRSIIKMPPALQWR